MSITVDNLAYAYGAGATAIDDVSFSIAAGELCAVIGPSGCGKSTLLKLLAGFLQPAAGRIAIGGRDMAGQAPRQRNLGVVFQSYALFPHMSALENVAYPLKLRGIAAAERRRQAGEALERAGLGGYLDRLPPTLSGGQQQRIALTRALVFRPAALLLDEPLSALDVTNRQAMRDEIRAVQREHGIATLHVTHDQEEALSIADRVIVMKDGRLLQAATPQELYRNPADRFIAGFVGQANLWPGRVADAAGVTTPLGPLQCDATGFAPGQPVTVMVRPEAVAINDAVALNRLQGQVVRDRFLGAVRRFDFAVAGGIVTGDTAGMAAVDTVSIPPDAIRLLADTADRATQPGEP